MIKVDTKNKTGLVKANLSGKIFGISIDLIKIFLVPLGVLMVFLITVTAIILPKIGQIGENNKKVAAVNKQIKSIDEKKSYLLSIDQEQLKKDAASLNSAVLQEKNSYLLVQVIGNVAKEYGYSITSFSISPIKIKDDQSKNLKVADKGVASKIPVQVMLAGPSNRNLDFIKSLESSLPILFIDKFDIKSSGGISILELTVSSYYMADNLDVVSGNLTLNDLKPTEEETELLSRISQFKGIEVNFGNGEASGNGFVKYERQNPFSL